MINTKKAAYLNWYAAFYILLFCYVLTRNNFNNEKIGVYRLIDISLFYRSHYINIVHQIYLIIYNFYKIILNDDITYLWYNSITIYFLGGVIVSVGSAVLLAISIAIFAFILIIFNACDYMLIDKIFSKISKKNEYMISFIAIVCLLVYLTLNLYNFIHNTFK